MIDTKVYRQISIYFSFFSSLQTRKLRNLFKKESILQSSKPSTSRIVTRFQEVDDTFIPRRNRRSFDFLVSTLSIFFILFIQETFPNFRNESIPLLTQTSSQSSFFEARIIDASKKKKRKTNKTSKDNQGKDTSLSVIVGPGFNPNELVRPTLTLGSSKFPSPIG